MSGKSKRTQEVKMRVPIGTHSTVTTYAEAKGLNRTEAYLHFIRQGIAAENQSEPATKADLVAFVSTLQQAIENQPIVIQEQSKPALESAEQKSRWKRLKEAWKAE